jgi:ABC-type Fe3+-siderophore transport system permease subunit
MSSAADPTAMLGISPFVLSFPSQTTVTLFLAFTIISIVLLLVILLSLALSTSLSRHPSLLVFLGALTVYLFGSILSCVPAAGRHRAQLTDGLFFAGCSRMGRDR